MSLNDTLDATRDRLLERAAPDLAAFEDLVIVPIFAFAVALILGAITMLATGVDLPTIGRSYQALVQGSVGSVSALSETLVAAIPLVLAALGLAIGFRTGLFNIGAEGQIVMGGLAAVIFGFTFDTLPFAVLLPLSLLAGALTGAFYASIAGWLRAATGAHEVISTIMLNLISYRLLDYMLSLSWVQREGRNDPVSQSVPQAAELPRLLTWLDPNLRLHAGVFVMLLAVALVYWLLFRAKLGFEFRASGASPDAARYAGMRASLIIVLAMAFAGRWPDLQGPTRCLAFWAAPAPAFRPGSGSTPSPWRFWGGPIRSGCCLPGSCSGRFRRAGGRCRWMRASAST